QEGGPGEPGPACRPRAHMEDNTEGGWERMDLGRARDRFLQRGEGLCHLLTRGAGVEVAAEGEFLFRFQLAVDKSAEVFQRFPTGRHGLLLSYMSSDGSNWARSLPRRARRARAMRERTVPIGQPTMSAISWYVNPSMSHNTSSVRISSGKAARARRISSAERWRSTSSSALMCVAAGASSSPSRPPSINTSSGVARLRR